jgi:hypothetical protein
VSHGLEGSLGQRLGAVDGLELDHLRMQVGREQKKIE